MLLDLIAKGKNTSWWENPMPTKTTSVVEEVCTPGGQGHLRKVLERNADKIWTWVVVEEGSKNG